MKTIRRLCAVAAVMSGGWMATAAADEASMPAAATALGVARLTTDGKLEKPANLERWVFLGTSLGMGYNPGSFNAARPGQFQVVLMEPKAYEHFLEHGSYAPGSMFVLSFYDTDTQPRSLNQKGFTQADLTNYEIHLIDPASPDGHTFYMFDAGSKSGQALPPGNGCVSCHKNHGAFQGTFAQFYPTLRPRVPKVLLEKASRGADIR
jgi:hypothetical protein